MIRHILLFKFNEGVQSEVQSDAVARLRGLGKQCPTVLNWVIGVNQANSPSAYDVAEIGDFADQEALDSYKEHPAHKELSAHLGTIASWALVDHNFPL
jgi:Stress responsive A/B Barrel Domain